MSERRQPPSDVNELLDRIDASWRRLMAAIDGVPDDRLAEPGASGDWSLQDLFGHFAFWDEHALAEIDRALAGLPREDNEWQAMNESDHAARRGQSAQEQRVAMHQAHAALTERLEGIANIDAKKVDAAIRADTYEHYDEHLPGIEKWRQRAGF
jgi:hypothetical protein